MATTEESTGKRDRATGPRPGSAAGRAPAMRHGDQTHGAGRVGERGPGIPQAPVDTLDEVDSSETATGGAAAATGTAAIPARRWRIPTDPPAV